jgi:hypothetical protein
MTSAAVALPAVKSESAESLADRRLPVAGNLLVRKSKGRGKTGTTHRVLGKQGIYSLPDVCGWFRFVFRCFRGASRNRLATQSQNALS